ncbi:hypothetical protein NDU88_004965 [Pleurodeles waltl]|uniref:Uncharacterized protein n=1 Tax=Pleurodeles waltl TaxID=8319 RepID=A0AAV7QDZ9_PLEWA|nr:hypothetical protein NDU88_004965 [Pleurodeles waltl]
MPAEDESVDEGAGQRYASAHAGKSWVEFSALPLHRCPLCMSRSKRGEDRAPPRCDPIRVAEWGAAPRLTNRPGRPVSHQGIP